ncbi:MAG: site-specific integrase [Quadrisphaera sp.]
MSSIAKRSDGTWRARFRNEDGKERSRHFRRKADAQRWLDEVTTAVVTGQYVDPTAAQTTLAEFYAAWSERQVWAPNTARAVDIAVRTCTFRDLPLGRLRRSHVESWVAGMRKQGLAPGTIRTRRNNVRSVLRAAVLDRHLVSDPSAGVTLPRVRRAEAAMRLPAPQEVAAVLAAAAEPETRVMVLLAAGAGLRLGELCGLQVADVDFLRRTVRVRRQLTRATGGCLVESPPKYGSERDVPVPDALLEAVARYVQEHRPGNQPTRWLLTEGGGAPLTQNIASDRWRRARRGAGVIGMRLHDLRHYFASGLIAAGVDVVAVQRALGHRSASVTLNTYSHLWPSAEDRTRTALAGLLGDLASAAPRAEDAADQLRTKRR